MSDPCDCKEADPPKPIYIEGPRGPMGRPGRDGATGPRGPQGIGQPGPAGPQGLRGAEGPQGVDGIQGAQGAPGPGADQAVDKGASPMFHEIIIVDSTPEKVEQGRVGILTPGWVDAFRTEQGVHQPGSGAVSLGDSRAVLRGLVTSVESLASTSGEMIVHVTNEGDLFAVEPPTSGWELLDSDVGTYNLGTGTVIGPWIPITGLLVTVTPTQVTLYGDRIDFFLKLFIRNVTNNRSGTIQIGPSINGANPTVWFSQNLSPNASGAFPFNVTSRTIGLSAGATISIKARISYGEHTSFGAVIDGSLGTLQLAVRGQVFASVTSTEVLSSLGNSIEQSGPRIGMATAIIGKAISTSGLGPPQSVTGTWQPLGGFTDDGPSFGSLIPLHAGSRIVITAPGIIAVSLAVAGTIPNGKEVTFGIQHKRGPAVLQDRDLFLCIGSNLIQESGSGEWLFDVLPGDELIAICMGVSSTSFTPNYLSLKAIKTTN